jgi:hypothetical protein
MQQDDQTWTLVHGSVQILILGRIAHAWLKRDGWVYDAVLDKSMPEADYIERLHAQECGTWDIHAAATTMLEANHWGPWVQS